jgi:hypothetical protein
MPDQFQPRLLHIKVYSYPGVPLVKLKPVNLLACMTGMIYASFVGSHHQPFLKGNLPGYLTFSYGIISFLAFLGFPLTTCILMFQAPSEAVPQQVDEPNINRSAVL